MSYRKKRGFYSFVSTLLLPKKSHGATFNIRQSWLPLVSESNEKQIGLLQKYRTLDVFPVLNERSYTSIAASLDLYALSRGLDTQSNLFRFRPIALNDYEEEGEDASITELLTRIREPSLEDRVVIESHNQSESVHVLEGLLVIMQEALKKENINIPSAIHNMKLRNRVSTLLGNNPFLAYIIFDRLPNLSILYISGYVNEIKSTFAFIRPNPSEIIIDEAWVFNEHIVEVVAS